MKTVLKILLIGLMINSTAKAQCITGMPNDTAVCANSTPFPFTIGGSPTLVGGIAPFNYSWSIDTFTVFPYSPTLNQVVYASHFLDDTTLANPTLYSMMFAGNDIDFTQVFYLTITDANGLSCTDTLIIQESGYVGILMDCTMDINIGDTVVISPTLYGGIPPVNYSWSPTIFLSDPNNLASLASPTITTIYTVTITDSAGCQDSSICSVYVNPLAIEETEEAKQLIKTVDILGKQAKPKQTGLLFYIYDDGTVEKKIIID